MNDEIMQPKVPSKVAEINAQIAASPLASQGISQAPSAITSSSLQSVNPLKVPQQPVSTLAEGITGASSALIDATKNLQTLQQAEDQRVADARAENKTWRDKVVEVMDQINILQSSRPDLEKQAGIEKKTLSYNTALTNLEASQRAQTNELRALDSQTGLTTSGKIAAQAAINRKYAMEQADYSLILSVANRDLTSAQNMVDRKVQLALEPLKTQLEFTKMFYEDNKTDLSKAEERAFGLKIKELEREYETQKTDKKAVSDIVMKLIEKGITPPQSILNAKNGEEATRELVRNGISLASGSSGGGVLASLPVSIQGKVLSQVDKFNSSDIVKKYNATIDSINIVNGISADSKNPADHQQIVYSFAKALDPDSAVKEGEYTTIKKYAQSTISKYGREIENAINGTGFLSKAAIENIKTTMNNTYSSRKPQYDNLKSGTARVINNVAGREVAGEIMIDFENATKKENDPLGLGILQNPYGTDPLKLNQ